MKNVITYQTPSGDRINLTPKQIEVLKAAGKWPRNNDGQEYCSVSHGLHSGSPSCDSDLLADLLDL